MLRILFSLLIVLTSVNAQNWQNFTKDNSGLPSNVVTSISIVDKTIWVTTDSGLVVFDGNTWKAYSDSDGLASDNNFSSTSNLEDLIVGSDFGISIFQINGLNITSPIDLINSSNSSILSDNILAVASDKQGNNWLGTDSGISIISTQDSIENLSSTISGVKMSNNYINSLSISTDTVTHITDEYVPDGGVVYAATNGGGVSRFYFHEVDGITSASIVQNMWSGLPSDTVLCVYVDDQNNHWYGTTNGVANHREHDSKNANWKIYDESDGLISNRVRAIVSDASNNTWFGTENGLSKFDGVSWKSYSAEDGLIDNYINDMKQDDNGDLWIATNGGLSKVSDVTSSVSSNHNTPKEHLLSLDTYPNPFNLEVNIKYKLSNNKGASLSIYNSIGELVREFEINELNNLENIIQWNGRDLNNYIVNSGIYFIALSTPTSILSRKIVLLK